jgi:hypothetical protein
MGQGIDLAREHAPEHARVMENFRDQLLIALLLRAGTNVCMPIAEVDATGDYVVAMSVTDGNFNFEVRLKQ